jgi:hypothetical protein
MAMSKNDWDDSITLLTTAGCRARCPLYDEDELGYTDCKAGANLPPLAEDIKDPADIKIDGVGPWVAEVSESYDPPPAVGPWED